MRSKGNREQAYQNFKEGMIHRLNAEDQGVSENTVKSWCSRYGSQTQLNATGMLVFKRF